MKKHIKISLMAAVAVAGTVFCGCTAVDPVVRADPAGLAQEGTIVFTRPARFTPWFGNYSLSQFIEVTYERASRNAAATCSGSTPSADASPARG